MRDGPAWTQLPTHTPPSCPFDTMVGELDALSQQLAKQGLLSIPEFRSAAPTVSALVDLASSPGLALSATRDVPSHQSLPINQSHGFSLSNMLVDFVTMGMPALHTTLERLTAAWAVFNLIRWRMCRSKEAFDALPPHYRPTRIQQSVSYPAWIDPIPWPDARDKVITHLPPSQYTRFRTMLHETYAIRAWSRPLYECLKRSDNGHWTLAPAFIQHLHDLNNVALTQKAVDEFPFLADVVNIVPSSEAYAATTDSGDIHADNNYVPLFA
ncbi:hypothetical protein SBRCBS47491_007877 [Sporothrix bragantina]|uniref:Uncharacterized protein n=1 Tax=Sporothrix bragantina TaxID=671064 RepID=A0ABP0CGS6_9PEZI